MVLSRSLLAAVAGVIISVALRAAIHNQSEAIHPSGWDDYDENGTVDSHHHLSTMTGVDAEDYCVGDTASFLATDVVQDKVVRVVHHAAGWEKVGYEIRFRPQAFGPEVQLDCALEAPDIEMKIWARDPAESECPTFYDSCVWNWREPDYNPLSGHNEYRKVNVQLLADDIADECDPYNPVHFCDTHVINHELGHVFGLADGEAGDCAPLSIMHNAGHGCPTNQWWPTYDPVAVDDVESVRAMIPSHAAGGGSNNFGKCWC